MSCTAVFAGEPIRFEYKPGALRDGTGYHQLMQDGVEEGNTDMIYEAVTKILTDWDLEISVDELREAGYFDVQYDDDGETVVREEIPVPEGESMKIPIDKYALAAADIPGPLYGVLTQKMREDAVSGGKETKKAR